MKNVRVATLNTNIKGLFTHWLNLTSPFHNLSIKEKEILSLFLYYHHKLRKEVNNEDLLWKIVFDYETKLKIKEELKIKDYALQNVMTSLRKKGAIQNKRINPSFVPVLAEDVSNYKIVFNININEG